MLVQEYGRYFGLRSACFRGGTLTGPAHAAAELHGFLAYVMRCAMRGRPYTIYGYRGKQVRDVIHATDLVRAFGCFFDAPRVARGLQPRRRPPRERLGARGDRARSEVAGRELSSTTSTSRASATTCGGSARTPASRATTPSGG